MAFAGSWESLGIAIRAAENRRSRRRHVHFADAAFQGALGGFQLQTPFRQILRETGRGARFLPNLRRRELVAIEDAGDVGEINQAVGTEIFAQAAAMLSALMLYSSLSGPRPRQGRRERGLRARGIR